MSKDITVPKLDIDKCRRIMGKEAKSFSDKEVKHIWTVSGILAELVAKHLHERQTGGLQMSQNTL